MLRRDFLIKGSMLIASAPLFLACESGFDADGNNNLKLSAQRTNTGLNRKQWQTVVAAQNHLLPVSNHAPGAQTVNAKAWLYAVLADPQRDAADRVLVTHGAQQLELTSQTLFAQSFIHLSFDQKEKALREFENNSGRAWIMTLLGYIFEALLTTPVYGGNPQAVGWRWLQHHPGFPLPSAEQRYFLL